LRRYPLRPLEGAAAGPATESRFRAGRAEWAEVSGTCSPVVGGTAAAGAALAAEMAEAIALSGEEVRSRYSKGQVAASFDEGPGT